jgi:SAM-dependent methyltransferase
MNRSTTETTHYTTAFFSEIRDGSRKSAQEILPLVLDALGCKSVVDVGCGVGTWLCVAKELGVTDVAGIDGDYVDKKALEIDRANFHSMDLSAPTKWRRSYELAISMEVAEHLPPEGAERFVSFLCELAPAVLFSAAIPGQGGTNHINEQWPEFWLERFAQQGFVALDFVREAVWNNPNVERWYAQNAVLFVRAEMLTTNPALKSLAARTRASQLSLVHPKTLDAWHLEIRKLRAQIRLLENENDRRNPAVMGFREMFRLLAEMARGVAKRVGRRKASCNNCPLPERDA